MVKGLLEVVVEVNYEVEVEVQWSMTRLKYHVRYKTPCSRSTRVTHAVSG